MAIVEVKNREVIRIRLVRIFMIQSPGAFEAPLYVERL